ncbi:unnamed protein product [Malus baccata var. baccata]
MSSLSNTVGANIHAVPSFEQGFRNTNSNALPFEGFFLSAHSCQPDFLFPSCHGLCKYCLVDDTIKVLGVKLWKGPPFEDNLYFNLLM